MAGGQIEMHLAGPLPVQRHHGIPAANLSEGQYGQEYPGPQQQDRLNHVRPDDGFQPAPDGVAGRDCRQSDDEEGVIEGVHIELGATGLGLFPDGGGTVSFGGECRTVRSMGFRVRCHRDPADGVAAQQDADRARADVERRHHLDDGHQDHHEERIGEAAALVVAGPQVVGEGVDLQPPEDGQKPVAEQHQSHDGPELEVGLGETHAEPDPHHPHHVVGADVAAENRAGHSPPGGVAAGQEEVLRSLLSAAGPETDGQHGHQRSKENDQVRGGQNILGQWRSPFMGGVHRSRSSDRAVASNGDRGGGGRGAGDQGCPVGGAGPRRPRSVRPAHLAARLVSDGRQVRGRDLLPALAPGDHGCLQDARGQTGALDRAGRPAGEQEILNHSICLSVFA